MSNKSNTFIEIGEIVEILMGRDKGKYAIILGKDEERFVLIADGDKRKFDSKKRKNIQHIRLTGFISKEIADDIKNGKRISNAKLRYVLQDFISKNYSNEDEKKGE